MAGVRIT